MDETESEVVVTAGQRLREAREAQGLSIEDIAAQTRIPTRHLASIEEGDWTKLPAATYTVGFAKNYAGALGLDRNEIGEQLRNEMGVAGPAYAHPEIYETADPARTMPKGLVLGALGVLLLVVLALTWLNNRSLEPDEVVAEAENVVARQEDSAAVVGGSLMAGATERYVSGAVESTLATDGCSHPPRAIWGRSSGIAAASSERYVASGQQIMRISVTRQSR